MSVQSQTLDDIARQVWSMTRSLGSIREQDIPTLMTHAAEQVLERWRETHPDATREDVLAAFARTRPTER